MNKLRSFCSLFLFLSFVLALFTPAYASTAEIPSFKSIETIELNEFDAYNFIKNASETELLECGYSNKQVEEFRNVDFEGMVRQRAQLSDPVLEGMGYTNDEINLLRNYDGAYADTRAITGTLTADIICNASTSFGYNISYEWSWDHAPIMCGTDGVSMRWLAFAIDSLPVDVSAGGSSASVNYHHSNVIMLTKTYTVSDSNFSNSTDFNALTCTFPMTLGPSYNEIYALSGTLRTVVTRDINGTRDIRYLKICGVYGHSVVSLGAPSVSFDLSTYSVGVSFSGGINTENLGIKKYKIYYNGKKEVIDA